MQLFVLRGEPSVEVPLTRSQTDPDAARRIEFALRTLSSLEDRDPEAIAAAVSMIDADILRARLPESLIFRNSVSLVVAERFVRDFRRFLLHSATAELVHDDAQDGYSAADSYAARCRFGHTFEGSFGFTIESPVGPNPDAVLDPNPPPPPFERRVVERVTRAFSTVVAAIGRADPQVIVESSARAFDADMCDSFAGLVDHSGAEAVKFEVELSPEWRPASDLPTLTAVEVSAHSGVDLVREAARQLRSAPIPQDRTVIGTIIRLETRDNPNDLFEVHDTRDILVDWQGTNVRIRLSPVEYLAAVDAHKLGRAIEASGELNITKRGLVLRNVRRFSVLA